MKRILVVDDDIELCNLLKQCLGNEGYKVECLHNGKNIMEHIHTDSFDLIILDVMLPEVDGFTILKQIRQYTNIPVLMLSAKSDEMNKVLGLRTGADDYLTKPFGLSELIARVENLFRRCHGGNNQAKEEGVLKFGNLEIDMNKCVIKINEEVIALTSKEYKLITFFAQNPEKVFTKKQIYENIWDDEFIYDDNTIMALISRLRKKIEKNVETPKYIQTVWGIGYRFHGEVK